MWLTHDLPIVDHRSNITFSLPSFDTKEDQEKEEEEEEQGIYTYGVWNSHTFSKTRKFVKIVPL